MKLLKTIRNNGLRSIIITLCMTPVMALWSGAPRADNYPSHPVKIIVPGPAGGTPDIMARQLGEQLQTHLKQTVIVDNRAGAAGLIGVNSVAKASPDGYTLLMGFAQTMALNPATTPNLPYDAQTDFAPIARLVEFELALVVPSSVPAHTLPELVSWLQANPSQANFGSFGQGTPSQFAGQLFSRHAGVPAVHVPYKGSAQLITELIGGRVHFGFVVPQVAMQHVESGKLRLLAITGQNRSKKLENVPTMKELGYDDIVAGGWYGLFAPKDTPTHIINQLSESVATSLSSPELKRRLEDQELQPSYLASKEFQRFQEEEIARWRDVVQTTGFVVKD